jgi:hypothetical protein
MIYWNYLIGSIDGGVECKCAFDEAIKSCDFKEVNIYLYGVLQPLKDLDPMFEEILKTRCLQRYRQEQIWQRLEKQFAERLGEKVIIEDEPTYIRCLWEFEKKTEDDNRMADLN